MKKISVLTISIFLIAAALALEVTQNMTVIILPEEISIYSPTQNALYTERQVPVNISLSTERDFLKYSDNGENLRTICRNCDEYGFSKLKRKPFDDGFHELAVLSISGSDVASKTVNFTVDTKKPNIRKTKPVRGFAAGEFEVEFREENPSSLFLNYGTNTKIKNTQVNISSCTSDRSSTICKTTVNLTEFNQKEIIFWFNLTDIAGRTDSSTHKRIDIDLTPPIITGFSSINSGQTIKFAINITEPNFKEVSYIDYEGRNQRSQSLCLTLKKGSCEKRKSFSRGNHNLTIEAFDDAGNKALVIENLIFRI